MTKDIGVWFPTEAMTADQAAAFAHRIEQLGYTRLWLGETFGRDPFVHIAHLGAVTEALEFATGIANVYHRHPGVMKQAANTVAEQLGGRMTLGLGVSSPQIVKGMRGVDYDKPFTFMKNHLDAMEAAFYASVPPQPEVPVVLAALGPKMVGLAGERTTGAHTYNVSPEHTRSAREILGPDAGLYVEQKVVLTTDEAKARETAKKGLNFYRKAPGYRSCWKRLGFSEEEIDSGAARFLDAIVAWGDEEALQKRVDEHFEAGASHVCIQPLDLSGTMGVPDWKAFEALAPTAAR